ncbi:MAG TPA: PilC/PilY family type IV pilus protein, partial [Thermoanaerobaculia bacterium]|nr:PilC/PilY family type IV pilus protein [Thermoanaerobaculia bacterium]
GSNTKWDAGEILSNPKDVSYMSPAERKIYTWDPANLGAGLIEVVPANQGTLFPISGLPSSKFTTAVIDFIRGNDGSLKNKARSWVFGASINSTPAVVGKPEIYTGNFQATHAAYEILHKNRKPIAWVGADDGMLHGFNFDTGKETIALVPPELLARQVTLYDNYRTLVNPITKERKAPTGQNPDIRQHIWGVAQSFRYADVYDTANSVWKTIGYLTLGPAGSSVTAIDVTHPSPTDEGYDASKPVEILWLRPTASDPLAGVGQSWSVPAVAANQKAPANFLLLMGAGFNAASVAGDQKDARMFQLQALDGKDGYATGTKYYTDITAAAVDAGNKPLIGQQAFAASVFFDSTAPTYYGNNIADLGLQADLNGRIWFNYPTVLGGADFDAVKIGIDVPKEIGNIEGSPDQAPLYYPPAASGVGKSGGCQVYSFGSGTSYEKSPLVTNPDGSSAPSGEQSDYAWKPRLFIAVNANDASKQFGTVTVTGPNQAIYSVPISSIELPACDPADPNYPGPRCRLGPSDPTTFGLRTQMTAPPFLLVPISGNSGGETFQALFLLYDPDAIGYCRGYSYVVVITFELNKSCDLVTVDKTEVFEGGEGAASGFAMAGTKIVVGKSGVGSGQKAGVFETPINILSYGGFGNVTPVYWKELQ